MVLSVRVIEKFPFHFCATVLPFSCNGMDMAWQHFSIPCNALLHLNERKIFAHLVRGVIVLWSEALSLLRVLTSSDHCSISWKMSLWRALREFPSLVSLAIPFFRVAPSWRSPPWSSFAEPRLHGANYGLPLWRRLLPFCRSLSPTYVSCRSLSFSLVSLIASFLCIARRLFRVACLSHCHLNCSLWLFNTPKINGYKTKWCFIVLQFLRTV